MRNILNAGDRESRERGSFYSYYYYCFYANGAPFDIQFVLFLYLLLFSR